MKAHLVQMVRMSDGVHLATDIWLPEGRGPFPVLLTRTPYHRAGALCSARTYTDWGYAYVVQDCRGKYDSEGEFRPLVDEARDGHDTLDWIAGQTWCNGRIGLVGKSYLGIVQIPAASGGHEALRCIVPGVAPNSFFRDWLRYDGCFAFANAVRWSLTHATCKTKPVIDHLTWDELYQMATLDQILERAGLRCPALQAWVDHDRYDAYWEAIDQQPMYDLVRVPGMHVGGWFDHLTRGQFDAFRGIGERGATEGARTGQRLLIGPWGHSTVGARGEAHRRYGDWDFGPESDLDVLEHERRFIGRWMQDRDDGFADEPPVKVFLMGENRWLDLDNWPPREADVQGWYLSAGGRGDGRLALDPGQGTPPDGYLYDPRDPTPTLGGPIYWGMSPLGPVDQRPILGRPDVLCYRSAPLERSLAVVGEVNLDLWIASSAPDTDFVAELCVVEPSGRVTCLALGSLRCRYRENWREPKPLEAGTPARIRIQMGHLAYVYPERSRIALLVTSSSFPRILPHPNTMAPTWVETSPQVARQQVFHGPGTLSRLGLPVLKL
jgi:putative CocE/NonD family hydrolase